MASIIKRKTNISVVYWYKDETGERKQQWDTCVTKKDAKTRKSFVEYYQNENGLVLVPLASQFAKEKELAEQELKNPTADITLNEFLKIFVDIYGVAKWGVTTYSHKTATIDNYINPIIGNWKLADITTKKLSEYYNKLLKVKEVPRANRPASGRCVQPPTIKKIHDIVRCALNQAIIWEYLDTRMRNPATNAILPEIQKNKRKVWNISIFKKAVSVVEDSLLELCMHLAFACSMRIGEVLGLTWEDIFIDDESINNGTAHIVINKELARISLKAMQKLNEKDIIFVFPTLKPNCSTRLVLKTPKTESSNRTVWLPKTVALLLQKYKKEQSELKEFLGISYNDYNLVIALDNGNPCESRVVRDRFDMLREEHSLEKVVFHSLRHLSTGYKLKMTNGDLKSVQGDTGHAEAEMITEVYTEIIDEDRRFNASKMEESFYAELGTETDVKVEAEKSNPNTDSSKDMFFANLIDFMADEQNRQHLQAMLQSANKLGSSSC